MQQLPTHSDPSEKQLSQVNSVSDSDTNNVTPASNIKPMATLSSFRSKTEESFLKANGLQSTVSFGTIALLKKDYVPV